MTPLEMWSVFFRYAGDERYETMIREIANVRREIAMANELLQNISQDEDERFLFREREKYQTDWAHSIIVSRREGLAVGEAKGRAEGKAEGIAEGEAKGATKIACKLLEAHMPPEQISMITGLSVDEIKRL